MSYFIKIVLFFSLIYMPAWLFEIEHSNWNYIREHLKDSNNIAAHDALILSLDVDALKEGRFIIDRVKAEEEYKKSLAANLKLELNMNPKSNSKLKNPVEILYFDVIDDSNAIFPFLYENEEYKIAEYLEGPAIVAVINNKQTLILNIESRKDSILAPTVYQYKVYWMYFNEQGKFTLSVNSEWPHLLLQPL